MSIKQDVKSIVSNTIATPVSLGATALKLAADGTNVVNKSAAATPAVIQALLATPFAAAKGYIMEAEGVSSEIAEERAYKYVKQDVSRTIQEAGEGSGKLLAALLKDDDLDVGNASKDLDPVDPQ